MMLQNDGADALLQACKEAAKRQAERSSWRLLSEDEWARRACEAILADTSSSPSRAVVFVYSQALHAACSGEQGSERQNRGYEEVFHYVYGRARGRDAEIAEEAAQRAMERTHRLFDRCRVPGAFLAYVTQQLLRVMRDIRNEEHRHGTVASSLDNWLEITASSANDEQELAAPLIDEELRRRFVELSKAFLRRHPRAKNQFQALRMKYIDRLDDVTIAERLETSIDSVYVLRSRATDRLRADPEWYALAVEFGLFPEDSAPPADEQQNA